MISSQLAYMSALEHNRDLLRTADRERRLPRRGRRKGRL